LGGWAGFGGLCPPNPNIEPPLPIPDTIVTVFTDRPPVSILSFELSDFGLDPDRAGIETEGHRS